MNALPALEVRDLTIWLNREGEIFKAVDGVSLSLQAGETLGLIGESGSGKSLTALSLLQLLPPLARSAGRVNLQGDCIDALTPAALRSLLGRRIAMIPQDPMTALNPLFAIGEQLAAPLKNHLGLRGDALQGRMVELLAAVGISAPVERLESYPHELSGGMLQRIVIAMAISCGPDVLIADEPTTGLDAVMQAQALDLLAELQRGRGMALILITHDLGVAARLCRRIAVMYAGKIVEMGLAEDVLSHPRHPYTRALVAASSPMRTTPRGALPTIPGAPPSLAEAPCGCAFAPRCSNAIERCHRESPVETTCADARTVRCWLAVS